MLYFACQIQISIKTILNKGIKLNQYLNLSYITKQCEHCDDDFNASLKEHKRGNARFCSLSCSSRRSRTVKENNHTCHKCKKDFYRKESKRANSRSGYFFCSRVCKEAAQKEDMVACPSHYMTGRTHKTYRVKAFRELPPSCIDCGYDKHKDILHVHHLDGDRSNNDIANLVIVCPTCHVERHIGLIPNYSMSKEIVIFKKDSQAKKAKQIK